MAYPTVSGPYGFLSVQNLGGRVFNQGTIDVPIRSAYAQNIAFGDLVAIDADGYLIRVDTTVGPKATFAIPPIGVFTGCNYTDPNLKYELWNQAWPAGTVANNALATVVNDPDVVLKAALTDASGAMITSGGATLATIGKNIGYYQATGNPALALENTITRDSVASLDLTSVGTAATLPFRVYAPVTQTTLPDGTFCELHVIYNWGKHFYRQGTGI